MAIFASPWRTKNPCRKCKSINQKKSICLSSYGIFVHRYPRDDPSQTLLTNRWKFETEQTTRERQRFSTELFRRRIGKFFDCCHLLFILALVFLNHCTAFRINCVCRFLRDALKRGSFVRQNFLSFLASFSRRLKNGHFSTCCFQRRGRDSRALTCTYQRYTRDKSEQ